MITTFRLSRKTKRPDGIFGEWQDERGGLLYLTLEHSYQQPDGSFAPKIVPGTYTCKRYESPKHGYDVFMLTGENADGHFYEVHVGNYNRNSDGCVLLGKGRGFLEDGKGWMLQYSQQAFDAFMLSMKEQDLFTLIVEA